MTWLTSLAEQLPLLLVLSPLIGFFLTGIAARIERTWIVPLAVSNALCTLLVLAGLGYQLESRLTEDRVAIKLAASPDAAGLIDATGVAQVGHQLDHKRVARLRQAWFSMDGLTLWPTLVLTVFTCLITWNNQAPDLRADWFLPMLLLLEATSIAAMTACDIVVYLIAYGSCVVSMAVVIGLWGGFQRRILMERFLVTQLCGGSLLLTSFASLYVSLPWMKMDGKTTWPVISSNIAVIAQDVQDWTTRNELAYQYQRDVFPWLLLVLSLAISIQFGLFPFHSCQIAVVSESPPLIALLYVVSILSACSVGWLRFVMPLAPEILASFDWILLVPSLGGALWGSLRALSPGTGPNLRNVLRMPELSLPGSPPAGRRQAAFVFLSLSGVALLGSYSSTRVGMSGAWLMQQQTLVSFAVTMLLVSVAEGSADGRTLNPFEPIGRDRWPQVAMAVFCVTAAVGIFASGCMILAVLQRESLSLVLAVPAIAVLLVVTLVSLMNRQDALHQFASAGTKPNLRWGSLLVLAVLMATACLFPNVLLRQSDPEFERVFRRFERPSTSNSEK